jgi:hypothetical protein
MHNPRRVYVVSDSQHASDYRLCRIGESDTARVSLLNLVVTQIPNLQLVAGFPVANICGNGRNIISREFEYTICGNFSHEKRLSNGSNSTLISK